MRGQFMFLSRLNEAQRRSFMALVTKMAMADGKVAAEEVKILEDIGRELGQTKPVPADEIFGATNIEPFDTDESRLLTVLGMLMVAFSDHKFHVNESTVLAETIEAFQIDDQKVEALKSWSKSQAELINKFHELIP